MYRQNRKVILINQMGSGPYYDLDQDGKIDKYNKDSEVSDSVVNKFINLSPFELHLPDHSFTGPGTKLKERLKEIREVITGRKDPIDCEFPRCSIPFNRVDESALSHDQHYSLYKSKEQRWPADQRLLDRALEIADDPRDNRELLDALLVASIMRSKLKLRL